MTEQELVIRLAAQVRRLVRPRLGLERAVAGTTPGGDASFALDRIAEEAMEAFLAAHDLDVAYHSEDRGDMGSPTASRLLIVDPIDGSRPARAGLETCCVSVALAANRPRACLRDVTHACLYELKTNLLFYAERGQGVKIWAVPEGAEEDHRRWEERPLCLSTQTDPRRIAWSLEVVGRPFQLVAQVLGGLVDATSVAGGVFTFGSSTFSLTRLLTGQLEAYIDVGNRILRDFPATEPLFRQAAQGNVMGLFPYDLAASLLIAEEAGAVVTDAAGQSLADVPLRDDSVGNQQSCLAAANADLHANLLREIEAGMADLGNWRKTPPQPSPSSGEESASPL